MKKGKAYAATYSLTDTEIALISNMVNRLIEDGVKTNASEYVRFAIQTVSYNLEYSFIKAMIEHGKEVDLNA